MSFTSALQQVGNMHKLYRSYQTLHFKLNIDTYLKLHKFCISSFSFVLWLTDITAASY